MLSKRICYYTRKVVEFGAVLPPDQKKNKYRADRLRKYRDLLDKQIESEGY